MVCVFIPVPACRAQSNRFDGNWTTSMACEAHGQMPAYKWDFPGTIKDGNFHAQHSEEGEPGYLVIDGPVKPDGSAKLHAKGTVTQSKASGVFAVKGNNYDYNIEAKFTDTSGTGTRDKGVGILGRPCTFAFAKQAEAPATPPASPQ
jgi:hypothetical protein